jgi:hypothetical protein
LIAEFVEGRRTGLDAVAALPPAAHDTVFLGDWSAHDIVAHLVGWDHANTEGVGALLEGRLPAFYAYYDKDWRTFKAGLVAQHKRATLVETIASAEASQRALLATVEAIPASAVFRDQGVRSPGGRRVTIAMLLTVEAADERKHAQQISAFS